MQGGGTFFIFFLILCIYLSTISIPPNQLTVHRASAKLLRILSDPKHSFSLAYVNTGASKNPHSPPYLFIHGHKGSVKQAISMAMHFYNNEIDIEMYSIDFSEGAVGLSYDLLQAEADFTVSCLNEISKRHEGQAITIIGHSFGGIVAALSLGNLTAGTVKGIIALGTPFKSPPINSDNRMLKAYDQVYKHISESDIFIISITGGIRDLVIPSQLTNIQQLNCRDSIHIYSTSISGLHKEIDHVAMVWGKEFFEILGSIVQLCDKYGGSRLIKEVRHLVTSEFSLMVENVSNESDVLIAVLPKDQELQDYPGLILGESIYYMLPKTHLETIPNSPKTQKLIKQSSNYSLISLLLGVKIPIKLGENLASYINPGPQFAEPRLSLHIKVIGEGQVQAVLAKCGHEEIIKYNENDFALYFHEYCENGPEIWMLGYDDEYEYTVELKIDVFATLLCMTRDFRLHIFTSMFYISLVNLVFKKTNTSQTKSGVWTLHGFIFVSLYLFGKRLTNLTIFDLEYFKADQNINYGLIDLIYIGLAGQGLFIVFDLLFEAVEWVSKKLENFGTVKFVIIPLVFLYPWPSCLVLLATVQRNKMVGKIVFLSLLSMLPQHAGWYTAFFTHGINGYDLAPLISCLFLDLGSKKDFDLTVELVVASIVTSLFCQDQLNRIVIEFQLLCFWGIMKSNLKEMIERSKLKQE